LAADSGRCSIAPRKRGTGAIRNFALGGVLAAFVFGGLAATSSAKTVWLCKPGQRPDPCTPRLSTTVYSPSFTTLRVEQPSLVGQRPIDCFYVYPTVSDQKTGNANLHIDPEERSVALYQAARYSQYCRVFAPMYRQLTLAGIPGQGSHPTTRPNLTLPFADVRAAFKTYLQKYNHGRGFVLIGHSQGSFVLRALIAQDVDPKPAVRQLLVSAILLGGNVVVKRGRDIGGDFKHIPACHSASQLGCVIAFSTFDAPPPANTLFGLPVSNELQRLNNPRLQVLCTNPAALGGGSGALNPISPSAPFAPGTLIAVGNALLHVSFPQPPTVWWTAPAAYSARCETSNGATVLQIRALRGAPTPTPAPTPAWGLHLLDANLALGNLISIVRTEAAAFTRRGR
jgi:hypothetical protein